MDRRSGPPGPLSRCRLPRQVARRSRVTKPKQLCPRRRSTSVTLTSEGAATAHIKTDPAATRALSRRVSAAGELEFNARRIVHLTARTPGRVERVVVVRGDRVREGQILAEIYCPDYLTLQAEYLMAAERAKRQSGDPAEAGPARALLESSRERLLLLGATPAEVDGLGALSVPRPLLPVRATLSGTVLEAGVLAGDWVDLGANLFRLADLTNLWACLHIQEKDLSSVKAGAEAVLRTQAYPGEDFRGRLVLVGDIVDAGTRTVEGRVEVPNPSGRLKPGMYVEASVAAAGARADHRRARSRASGRRRPGRGLRQDRGTDVRAARGRGGRTVRGVR